MENKQKSYVVFKKELAELIISKAPLTYIEKKVNYKASTSEKELYVYHFKNNEEFQKALQQALYEMKMAQIKADFK